MIWRDTNDCEYDNKPRARGVRKHIRPHLGKELGKYSYCDHCDKITLNVPGKTYCEQPLDEHTPMGWVIRNGQRVEVTGENMPNLFFACEECGREKFWGWGYHCPICDCGTALILEATEPQYDYAAAMEFGGSPKNWSEKWKCLMCGQIFWIGNSNY